MLQNCILKCRLFREQAVVCFYFTLRKTVIDNKVFSSFILIFQVYLYPTKTSSLHYFSRISYCFEGILSKPLFRFESGVHRVQGTWFVISYDRKSLYNSFGKFSLDTLSCLKGWIAMCSRAGVTERCYSRTCMERSCIQRPPSIKRPVFEVPIFRSYKRCICYLY